jgi:dephospho-CoA kinase
MAAQIPEATKVKAADYVIDNSGSIEHTREQVRQLWEKLHSQLPSTAQLH